MPIVPRPHGIRPQPSRIRALPVSARILALVIVIVPVLAGCSEPAARVTATASASSSPTPTRQVTVAVPNVVGMKGDAAADTLKEAGFTEKPTYADVDGEETVQEESGWTVTAQGPQADTQAPVDQPITLMVRHDRADASASASAVATEPESAPEPAQAQEPESAPEPAQAQEPEPAPEPAQPQEPEPAPEPAQPQEPEPGGVYYRSCKEAKAAGAAPLYQGEPGYRPGLDRDHDGIACEK